MGAKCEVRAHIVPVPPAVQAICLIVDWGIARPLALSLPSASCRTSLVPGPLAGFTSRGPTGARSVRSGHSEVLAGGLNLARAAAGPILVWESIVTVHSATAVCNMAIYPWKHLNP